MCQSFTRKLLAISHRPVAGHWGNPLLVSQWPVGKFLDVQPVVTGQWGISPLADRWLVASSLCAPLAASFQWDPI